MYETADERILETVDILLPSLSLTLSDARRGKVLISHFGTSMGVRERDLCIVFL